MSTKYAFYQSIEWKVIIIIFFLWDVLKHMFAIIFTFKKNLREGLLQLEDYFFIIFVALYRIQTLKYFEMIYCYCAAMNPTLTFKCILNTKYFFLKFYLCLQRYKIDKPRAKTKLLFTMAVGFDKFIHNMHFYYFIWISNKFFQFATMISKFWNYLSLF